MSPLLLRRHEQSSFESGKRRALTWNLAVLGACYLRLSQIQPAACSGPAQWQDLELAAALAHGFGELWGGQILGCVPCTSPRSQEFIFNLR